MRILHAIQTVDPASGGPFEGILQLAHAASPGIEHRIVSGDDPQAPWVAACPLPVTALGPASVLGYTPRLAPWLRQHHGQFDAVVVHGLWRYISFGTWRGLRGSGVPYVVFSHGMLDPWFKRRYPVKHVKKWLFWPWTEYRVLRDARTVLFTCEEERQRARESFWLYRCHESVIRYGIVQPPGDREAQRSAFLDAFPHLKGKRLVLFLGRLHPKKGCDLLLEAFAAECRDVPDLCLVFAGPDQAGTRAALELRLGELALGEQVVFTDMLGGDLKWGAIHAAEVFALPSHQENFGIAVAEALACGVPVLISREVQIWREIQEAAAGLVEADDLAGTRRLLKQWLALDPKDREAMGQRAQACFMRCFEASAYAAHFEELLRGLTLPSTADQEKPAAV